MMKKILSVMFSDALSLSALDSPASKPGPVTSFYAANGNYCYTGSSAIRTLK